MDIVTGDDAYIKVTLTREHEVFTIQPDAIIHASIIDKSHQSTIAGPVLVEYGLTGADWTKSLLVVLIPGASTQAVKTSKAAVLEIQVDDLDIKTTWFAHVDLVRGTIA